MQGWKNILKSRNPEIHNRKERKEGAKSTKKIKIKRRLMASFLFFVYFVQSFVLFVVNGFPFANLT
jgi:hypothetical protein